jgi:hypothetical protein
MWADCHKETQRIKASFCTAEIPELFMLLAAQNLLKDFSPAETHIDSLSFFMRISRIRYGP